MWHLLDGQHATMHVKNVDAIGDVSIGNIGYGMHLQEQWTLYNNGD